MSAPKKTIQHYIRVARRKLGQHVIHTPEFISEHYQQEDPWGYEQREDDAERRNILLDVLTTQVPNVETLRILDIGCGEGFITRELPGAEVVGIDISEQAIKRANNKTSDPRIKFFKLDLNRLSETQEQQLGMFDVIIATGVFYKDYLEDDVIKKILKHLKPDGWLLSSHIREWEKQHVPLPIVHEQLFRYRSYEQHLTLHANRPAKVSVVLPIAGKGAELPRAIASVAKQSYRPLELIVINDGYTGDTPIETLLAQHSDLKTYQVIHEKNLGVSAGRNSGISQATGDFITFFSGDDEMLPHKINEQVNMFMKQDPRVGAVSTCALVIDRHAKAKTYPRSGKPVSGTLFPHILSQNLLVSPMFRKSAYTLFGNYSTQLQYGEDWEFHMRLLEQFTVASVNNPGIKLYTHDGQLSSASLRRVADLQKILRMHEAMYNNHPKAHADVLRFIASSYADAMQFAEAKTWFKKSLSIAIAPKAFVQYLLLAISPKLFVWIYQMANRLIYGVDRWHTNTPDAS